MLPALGPFTAPVYLGSLGLLGLAAYAACYLGLRSWCTVCGRRRPGVARVTSPRGKVDMACRRCRRRPRVLAPR